MLDLTIHAETFGYSATELRQRADRYEDEARGDVYPDTARSLRNEARALRVQAAALDFLGLPLVPSADPQDESLQAYYRLLTWLGERDLVQDLSSAEATGPTSLTDNLRYVATLASTHAQEATHRGAAIDAATWTEAVLSALRALDQAPAVATDPPTPDSQLVDALEYERGRTAMLVGELRDLRSLFASGDSELSRKLTNRIGSALAAADVLDDEPVAG